MTNKVKITIILGSVATAGLLGGFVVYPSIKRFYIRKRLSEAYDDPSSVDAVGGMDKLLVTEAFDIRKFDEANNNATISRLEARERAKQVWDNYSAYFSSNTTAIISAFNNLEHIDDVSKIAHEFYESYDEELLSVLKVALADKSQYNLFLGKMAKLSKD